MKQQLAKIGGVFIIVVLAMNIILPLHVAATPGTVTISGTVRYQPRNWNSQNWRPAKEFVVQLWEYDLHGHNHLLNTPTVTTDSNGYSLFHP